MSFWIPQIKKLYYGNGKYFILKQISKRYYSVSKFIKSSYEFVIFLRALQMWIMCKRIYYYNGRTRGWRTVRNGGTGCSLGIHFAKSTINRLYFRICLLHNVTLVANTTRIYKSWEWRYFFYLRPWSSK